MRILYYKRTTLENGILAGKIESEDAYPNQLEKVLNQRKTGIKFSVINKGLIAVNTTIILEQLEDFLNKYNPDMVITMMGQNDGSDLLPYGNIPVSRESTIKLYRLAKIFWYHITNKATEKKEDITVSTDDLIPPPDSEEEEQRYKKSIETDPENDGAYVELGRYYGLKHQFDKAEELLKKTLAINPKNFQTYSELGEYYITQGMHDKAEKIYQNGLEINPESDVLWSLLAMLYQAQGKNESAVKCFEKTNKLRSEHYNPVTRRNYLRLKKILTQRGIQLVAMQYPVRSVGPLKKMLEQHEGIIFVDNEMVFKEALRHGSYYEYFFDSFAGDFGHATRKGNRLLAENIANVILKEMDW